MHFPFSSYACYYDEERKTFLGDVYSIKWLEGKKHFLRTVFYEVSDDVCIRKPEYSISWAIILSLNLRSADLKKLGCIIL